MTLSPVSTKDNRPVSLYTLRAPQQKVVGVVQLVPLALPLTATAAKQPKRSAFRPELSGVTLLAAFLRSFVIYLHRSVFRAAQTHTRVRAPLAFCADLRDRV